jgi:hypothetical protein
VFGSFIPETFETGSHYEWLKKNWLRPSYLSIREIGSGLLGLSLALWLISHSLPIIVSMWILAVVGVGTLWFVQRLV